MYLHRKVKFIVAMSGEDKRLFLGYLSIKSRLFSVIEFILDLGHDRRIGKLENKSWFEELRRDSRYGFIIWNNDEVRSYLAQPGIIELLKTDEQARKEFVDLVIREHKEYVGID